MGLTRRSTNDRYDDFVDHPHYGRGPRHTGLDPRQKFMPPDEVILHWNAAGDARIPGTAIPADPERQIDATVPVTHYFDVRRECRGCGRPFIFFAEEQQYWYEELGLRLDVDCVRCVPCRRVHRGLERRRARYEELLAVEGRSVADELELAECCAELSRAGYFGTRALDVARGRLRALEGRVEGEERADLERTLARIAEARVALGAAALTDPPPGA